MLHEINLSRLDLNLLVLFEAVFEERHVGRAASRLHLSASAVSHGLGRLRRAMNDPVFLSIRRASCRRRARPSSRRPSRTSSRACAPSRRGAALRSAPLDAPLRPRRARRRRHGRVAAGARRRAPQRAGRRRERNRSGARARRSPHSMRAASIRLLSARGRARRFESRPLYEDDFVIAARGGHPLARPSLERYAAAQHLLVSPTGARAASWTTCSPSTAWRGRWR